MQRSGHDAGFRELTLWGTAMHIFTRQVNEGVVIGDDIRVTILEVGEDFVRLSVSSEGDAPHYEEFVLAGPRTDILEGFAVGRRLQLQF